MTFWKKITGSDIPKAMQELEARVGVLPGEYQQTWHEMPPDV